VVVRHTFARYDDDGDRGDKKYYSGRAMDAVRRLHEDTQRWESKDRAAELSEIKAMQPAVNSDKGLGHTSALSAGSGGGGGDGGGGGSGGGESDAVPVAMPTAIAPSTVPASSTTFSQPKTQVKSSPEASPSALLPPVALSPPKAVAKVVATVSVAKPGKVVLGFGGKRKQLMASGASAFADDDDEDGKKKRKKTKIAVWTDEECVVALMLRGRCRGRCCLSHPAAPTRSHAHTHTHAHAQLDFKLLCC
jgi:hypothetical protein